MTLETSARLIEFLRSLRAVREYTPEPVTDDILQDIIEVGRWSGSASNKSGNCTPRPMMSSQTSFLSLRRTYKQLAAQ